MRSKACFSLEEEGSREYESLEAAQSAALPVLAAVPARRLAAGAEEARELPEDQAPPKRE